MNVTQKARRWTAATAGTSNDTALNTISGKRRRRGPSESVCILRRFSSRRTSSDGGKSQKPRRPSRRQRLRSVFSVFPASLFRQAVFYYCIVSHARAHARGKNKSRPDRCSAGETANTQNRRGPHGQHEEQRTRQGAESSRRSDPARDALTAKNVFDYYIVCGRIS